MDFIFNNRIRKKKSLFFHPFLDPINDLLGIKSYLNERGKYDTAAQAQLRQQFETREQFIQYDRDSDIRKNYLQRLQRKLSLHNMDEKVVCTLGGETSFDIYPLGWDKTYALRHFEHQDVWFIGDRCDHDGNDRTLYEILEPKGRGFKTTGPTHTKEIIQAINGHLSSWEDK